MFVVTEADAAAIRAAFDRGGELSARRRAAPATLRRHQHHPGAGVGPHYRRLEAAASAAAPRQDCCPPTQRRETVARHRPQDHRGPPQHCLTSHCRARLRDRGARAPAAGPKPSDGSRATVPRVVPAPPSASAIGEGYSPPLPAHWALSHPNSVPSVTAADHEWMTERLLSTTKAMPASLLHTQPRQPRCPGAAPVPTLPSMASQPPPLPARVGPCEFSMLGAMVAVHCRRSSPTSSCVPAAYGSLAAAAGWWRPPHRARDPRAPTGDRSAVPARWHVARLGPGVNTWRQSAVRVHLRRRAPAGPCTDQQRELRRIRKLADDGLSPTGSAPTSPRAG